MPLDARSDLSIRAAAIALTMTMLIGAPLAAEAGEKPPANRDAGAPAVAETVRFTAAKITELRDQAATLMEVPEKTPEGWSKSRVDPTKILRVFPALKLREGFTFRAYQYLAGGNGNGVVWAIPIDAEFPAPEDCPTLENRFLNVPKPLDALDDVMDAITGDDTAEAYLQASLLRRELKEFGAMWHGILWGTHYIVDADPLNAPRDENDPMRTPHGKSEDWKWLGPRPADWRPRVTLEAERAVVEFYTFSGYRKESVYRYVDTYRRGKFRARVEETKIAEGGPGFVF